MRRSRGWLIALVSSTLLFASSCGCGRSDGLPDRSFDAAVWKSGDRRTRGAMVTDLERSGILIGRTKAQVVQLLGMPDAIDTLGHDLEYPVDLGLRTGPFGSGGTWLFITHVRIDSATARAVSVRTSD